MNTTTTPEIEYLTMQQCARWALVSLNTVRSDVKSGLLKTQKTPGVRGHRIRMETFNAYLKRKFAGSRKAITPEDLDRLRVVLPPPDSL